MTTVYSTVKKPQSTIDVIADQHGVRTRSRHSSSTNLAIAEAVAENPLSGNKARDKEFCSYKQFNRLLRKTYPVLQSPLTHAQWEYLVTKANQAVGQCLDKNGHVELDAIFTNRYALAVHHILVAYATKYGKSHSLKMLNSYNRNLHSLSEGDLIAAEAAIEMVNPRITIYGGQESITSKTIRNLSNPAFITGEIQLRFKNYIFREFDAYSRSSKLNPVERAVEDSSFSAERRDVYGLPESYEARKWHQLNQTRITDPTESIRYTELEELFQNALTDLRDEAKECIAYGELDDISVRSVKALQAWSDPTNSYVIAEGESFLHQLCLVLTDTSRYHCRKIHEYIVAHFRKVLEITVEQFNETILAPADPATRSNWNNGKHPTYPNKYHLAVMAKITQDKNRFTSRLLAQGDQVSLNKYLYHGHFFINDEMLLDLN